MKQFILKKEPENNAVRLEGNDYHYLVHVRRLAVGECFPALLPNGSQTLVQILSIDRGILAGKCSSPLTVAESNLPPVILLQALPKGEKMDLIVRQAAEGGIGEIIPFVSEFSLPKTGMGGQKFSRWERIIREARQQSGSKTATALRPPMTEREFFDHWKQLKTDGALGLLFHHQETGGADPLENKSLHRYLNSVPSSVVLAIGPEGGFSDKEVALFMENGFNTITIGDTVLRTETAALYFAAAIRILLLERDSWELKQAKPDSE